MDVELHCPKDLEELLDMSRKERNAGEKRRKWGQEEHVLER